MIDKIGKNIYFVGDLRYSSFFTAGNAVCLGLVLRLAVAVWNSFFGPSYGAANDAAGFHAGAVAFAKGHNFVFYHADVYMYVLGSAFYRVVGDSLFLGCLLSCLAWLGSAIVLLKMMRLLSFNIANQFWVMLLYALWPSAILITSVTLREPYQALALNFGVYCALAICLNKSKIYWIFLMVGIAGLGLLHWALLMVGLFIAGISFIFSVLDRHEKESLLKIALLTIFVIAISYACLMLLLSAVFNIDIGLATAVQLRQDSWQQIARAHYSIGIAVASDLDLLFFVPVALFHYLFQPMPWHVSTAADIGLFLENVLRAWLLWRVFLTIHQLSPKQRAPVLIVFSCYLATEILWAIGTINWGTAARHHVPSLGLLVLAAFAAPSRKF